MTSLKALPHRLVRTLLAAAVAAAGAASPPNERTPAAIAATQVTLRLGSLQGRATVISVAGRLLTILTAAHFLSAADAGKAVLIQRPEGELGGRLSRVTPNPAFPRSRMGKPYETPAREVVGVDTAIALIRVDPSDEPGRRVLAAIRPAELAPSPIPAGARQVLLVHVVDQAGEEHVVRAGNHLNPRCLAWGRRGFDTRRGDSGAGVFVMRTTAEGTPRPVLIGSVSQVDERGGIASLVHGGAAWVAGAVGRGP